MTHVCQIKSQLFHVELPKLVAALGKLRPRPPAAQAQAA